MRQKELEFGVVEKTKNSSILYRQFSFKSILLGFCQLQKFWLLSADINIQIKRIGFKHFRSWRDMREVFKKKKKKKNPPPAWRHIIRTRAQTYDKMQIVPLRFCTTRITNILLGFCKCLYSLYGAAGELRSNWEVFWQTNSTKSQYFIYIWQQTQQLVMRN
jgi:hypothetical protein